VRSNTSLGSKNRSKRRQKNEREYRQLLELNCQQLALQIEILQLEKKLTKENLQSLDRENKLDRLLSKRENYKQFEV
jgi:GAF domain-containing protein